MYYSVLRRVKIELKIKNGLELDIYIFKEILNSYGKQYLLLKYALKQMFMVRAVTSYVHQHQKR